MPLFPGFLRKKHAKLYLLFLTHYLHVPPTNGAMGQGASTSKNYMDGKGDDFVDEETAQTYVAAIHALMSELNAQKSLYTVLGDLVDKTPRSGDAEEFTAAQTAVDDSLKRDWANWEFGYNFDHVNNLWLALHHAYLRPYREKEFYGDKRVWVDGASRGYDDFLKRAEDMKDKAVTLMRLGEKMARSRKRWYEYLLDFGASVGKDIGDGGMS